MTLEEFSATRGFTEDELAKWDITVEGEVVYIPTLGRSGAWYRRIHRPDGQPKYFYEDSDVDVHLYNPLGLGPNSEEVWIAEGEFDTLSLVTVGAPALGILGIQSFRREWALLFSHARVILAFDPDTESEDQATRVRKVAQLWPEHQVERFDPLVEGGYDDLNDWFREDRKGFTRTVLAW